MSANKHVCIGADVSTAPNNEGALNNSRSLLIDHTVLDIFMEAVDERNLLNCGDKHNLRATCRALKSVIDPYLTKVYLNPTEVFSDADQFRSFRESSLISQAKSLFIGSTQHSYITPLTREDLKKLGRVSFTALQEADVVVDSGALVLLPRTDWPLLKKLKLTVFCNMFEHSSLQLKSFWRRFSKAKNNWPLLENLELRIYHQTGPGMIEYADLENDIEDEDDPRPDIGHTLACFLPNLPKLKHLKVNSRLDLEDVQALAALPAATMENIESVDLKFVQCEDRLVSPESMKALAQIEWPKLKNLTLGDLGTMINMNVTELASAPWLCSLNTFQMYGCFLLRDHVYDLFRGFQRFGCAQLEHLTIENIYCDAVGALAHLEHLKKLKSISVIVSSLETEDGQVDHDSQNAFNQGLASFFTTANLPNLESLTITHDRPRILVWDTAPTRIANKSILPALKTLKLSKMKICKDCSSFLARTFYRRGGCDVDLNGSFVESGVDNDQLSDILRYYRVTMLDFEEELFKQNLYKEVYWYNLIPMDDLKSIAASVFLENLEMDMLEVAKPAKSSMEMVMEIEKNSSSTRITPKERERNENLQKRFRDMLSALEHLNAVLTKVNADTNGECSGAGGGSAKCGNGRKRRAPSPAPAI